MIAYFKSILALAQLAPISASLQWFLNLQPFRCSQIQRILLSSTPSDDEITLVLFKLNPNKAPGQDGLTFAFFKSAWSVVGPEMLTAVKQFFVTGFLPRTANAISSPWYLKSQVLLWFLTIDLKTIFGF